MLYTSCKYVCLQMYSLLPLQRMQEHISHWHSKGMSEVYGEVIANIYCGPQSPDHINQESLFQQDQTLKVLWFGSNKAETAVIPENLRFIDTSVWGKDHFEGDIVVVSSNKHPTENIVIYQERKLLYHQRKHCDSMNNYEDF